jgi:membrane protease YdiL (CAAX protease family)
MGLPRERIASELPIHLPTEHAEHTESIALPCHRRSFVDPFSNLSLSPLPIHRAHPRDAFGTLALQVRHDCCRLSGMSDSPSPETSASTPSASAAPESTPPISAPAPITALPASESASEPASIPPVLVSAEVVPKKSFSWALALAVVLVGLLNLLATLPGWRLQARLGYHLPYRLGYLVGGLLILPLIVMGIFAIWRRFRHVQPQLVILLVVWTLQAIASVGRVPAPRPTSSQSSLLDFNAAEKLVISPGQSASSTQSSFSSRVEYAWGPVTTVQTTDPKPTAEEVALAATFDFSPGSAERLLKTFDSAQEDRYRKIVEAYAAVCATCPDDADLAVERVKFIARFVDAEENTIARAEDDYQTAIDHLRKRFSAVPVAILYDLERSYGSDFDQKARKHLSEVASWPAEEAAKYWLLRAQRAEATAKTPGAGQDEAEKSFNLHPTPDAGMRVAQRLHAAKKDAEAIKVLLGSVFSAETDEMKKERMDLLFDLGQSGPALIAFQALKQHAPALLQNFPTAMRLAAAGQTALAREIADGITATEWNAKIIVRRRFEFELRYGGKERAVAAYRALRAHGFLSDPLLRDRLSLFRRFPTVGLFATDLLGLAAIACGIVGLILAAGLLLMPVHYWSLWRRLRGSVSTWDLSPWGLGTLWSLLSLTLIAAVAATWYFDPAALLSEVQGHGEVQPTAVMPVMVCVWLAVSLAAIGLMLRDDAIVLLRPGAWSTGKTVGYGLLAGVTIWMAAVIYLVLVPAARPAFSALTPNQLILLKSTYAHAGAFGLLGLLAGFVPVFEEVTLRGFMLGAFAKNIPWVAANLLQAVVFALLHDSFALFPFFVAFGYVSGELVRRSASLVPSILMHATNNFLAGVMVLIANAFIHILK